MFRLLVISLLSVCIANAQNNTFLKGKITNPVKDKCYLYTIKTDKETNQRKRVMLDSSLVKADGSFALSCKLDESIQATFSDGNEITVVLLDKGDDLTLTLNTSMFDETVVFSGKGSEKNNAVKSIALIEEGIGKEFFDNQGEMDTTKVYPTMEKKYDAFRKLLKDYKKDIPALDKYIDAKLTSIDMTIKQTKEFIRFSVKMAKLKGTRAIDFEGVDLKGNKVNISSFKGKTTVIDFWATWCGPCIAEVPSLKKLEEKYGADINFVSVGLYCKKDEWAKMAADFGFMHNIFLDKAAEKQIASYDVMFIPRYIVVDKDLNILDAQAPRPSSGDLEKYF